MRADQSLSSSGMLFSLTLFALGVWFTGCSAEPSESDITKTYEKKVSEMPAVLAPKLYGIKKLGCAKAEGNRGYNCDLQVDAEVFGQRNKNGVKVRFVKADDGWVLMEETR